MRITTVFFLIFLLAVSSCTDKKEVSVDPRLATDTLHIKFQSQRRPEIILTEQASTAMKNWDDLKKMDAQVKSLDTINLYNLRHVGSKWIKTALNVVKEPKDSVVNTAIESRITVFYSKTNTLIQEASKLNVDTSLVNKEATEYYNAFQNLKLQLNLKYQESIEELLEKYEIKADSLSAKRDSIVNAKRNLE